MTATVAPGEVVTEMVALADVVVAVDNPRTHLDGIEELAESIAQLGQLVPIIVERRDDARFDLLAGHRRCAALRFLDREYARADVRVGAPLGELDRGLLMLAENAQRRPVDPIDEANAYRRLMDEHNLSQSELARRTGVQQVLISSRLMLLRLSPADQARVRSGALTLDAARKIANPEPKRRASRGGAVAVDPGEQNVITFAVTEKEHAEVVRRCKAQNITVAAFARAALQKALRAR